MGKILRVNLSQKEISVEPLDINTARMFFGGRGLGAKIIFDEVKAKTHPFSPENKIVFATSPLNGTTAPSCSRFSIVTKSPLTNTITMASSGGFFGAELKFAGYDAVIVEGKADVPSYLWINDREVKIRDAGALWGLNTSDTQDYLKQLINEHNVRIACIGPGGENLVKYAAVISDKRAAGRGGVGAVMGSKNLKAVAVQGTGKVNYADKKAFRKAIWDLHEKYQESPALYSDFASHGTPGILELIDEYGILPTRNFQSGTFENMEKIDALAQKTVRMRHVSCYMCPISCGKIKIIKSGSYAGMSSEGPEYESTVLLGPNCGIDDLDTIIAADRFCDEYGIDTMSTGNTIGFAMELYERNIISIKDTDGIDLKFGNGKALLQMIRKIAFRDGFGDVLAEGVKIASEKIGNGAENYAIHCKGLELPAYDPRGAKAHGFAFAVSPRGACHNKGYAAQEIFGKTEPEEVDRFEVKGKGRLTKWNQDYRTIGDSANMCTFVFDMVKEIPESVADLWAAVSGFDVTEKDVWIIGERVNNIERAFNIREGFTRKDDILPRRFMEEAMPEGASKGEKVTKKDFNLMLDEYYEARGWDRKGIPRKSTLDRLGMSDVAENLEAYTKLSK